MPPAAAPGLQQLAPASACTGCGLANDRGSRIASRIDGDLVALVIVRPAHPASGRW